MKPKYMIFVGTFIVLMLLTKTTVPSGNPASRFASVESLVERGTWAIDNSSFFGDANTYDPEGAEPLMMRNSQEAINGTNDMVQINGRFYSDKPPVLSLLAAFPYLILYNLGITFSAAGNMAVYLLTLFTVGLSVSLLAMLFFIEAEKTGQKTAGAFTLLMIFGTLILPYSVTFNNHIFSAVCIFASYTLIRNVQGMGLTLAGFLAGMGFVIDLVSGGVFMALFGVLVIINKGWKSALLFCVPCVFPLILHCIINIPITGDVMPGAMHPEYWDYPGSDFSASTLTGVSLNLSGLTTYTFHLLFGYRGMFLFFPVLLFACIYLLGSLRVQKERLYSLSILTGSVAVILYYALFSDNFGGWSYGVRWFVPLIPILMTGLYRAGKINRLFIVASVISIVSALIGLYQPWTDMWYSPIPFINNLREIAILVKSILFK